MKFTLAWLKDHLETDADLETVTHTLTMIGMELEGVEDRGAALAPFVVGYVTKAEKHPNADRLQVCHVDTGAVGEPVQVICGAPNARTGMKGVFAPPGSHIPGTGIDLEVGEIRGVESRGMLCSEREMGLSDDHEGIIELPDDAPVGVSYAEYAGLNDPVIDVAITPNRADCLGVRGIARDLAAAGLGTLEPLDTSPVRGSYVSPVGVRLDLPKDKTDACPMFVGRHFRGVTNGPSPQWMQRRLRAIGLRPISALVDITNYVTYDLCRPLHVFDAAKVDRNIVVRMGRAGETFLALDGREYTLDEDVTVIADESRAEGLGGVMGGEESGCTPGTTEVMLEVAYFDPIRTAQTGRRLGILSDARYRFERGVDPSFLVDGAEIATRLILELCGGEASELVVAGGEPAWRRSYPLRHARTRELIGMDVPAPEQKTIFGALGFEVKAGEAEDAFEVGVPPWRGDIVGEADLVEEVARIQGYDAIPTVPMHRAGVLIEPARDLTQRRTAHVRRALAARGLAEAVTFSFMSSAHTGLFGGDVPALKLLNPISADLDEMRPSILPNLIQAAGRNADRGIDDAALFEIGPQFASSEPDGQKLVAAGVRRGDAVPRHWDTRARPADAIDAKADALAVLEAAGAPAARAQVTEDAPGWYHPGRSGTLRLGPNVLANFGEVHPRILRALDVEGPMVAFEAFLENVPAPRAKDRARPPFRPSPYQPVTRDFAFVVDAEVRAETLVRTAKGADKALIAGVEVFDVYAGKGIPEGSKSLAIAVTLQPSERTLTDEEIDAVGKKIVAAVEKATGGTLRG